MTKRLYLKTFGCQMNERDSEIISQLLAQDGYVETDIAEGADVILVNTCSIREKAAQKVFSLLGSLRAEKLAHPSLLLGVTGCVAQQEGERIIERMPHVDLIVGTQQIYRLPEMLDRLHQGVTSKEIATNMEPSFAIPPFQKLLAISPPSPSSVGFKRFVTIMQGCDNYCSYCVVPSTRGREISRSLADILEEVEILVDQGVKEITLLGQNVNSYGATNAVAPFSVTFPDLLRRVASVPELRRLRFTTSHPKDLSAELIRCFGEIDILCSHFHLPVQSGSNAVLRRMNRNYTVEQYLDKVAALQHHQSEIALTTDVIVGFPGETDADFQATMELLDKVRFHGSFSFKYSDRPHTRSTEFDNKVADEIKSRRLSLFQKRQDQICLEQNSKYIGKTVEVMVESSSTDSIKGRTATNHIVHCPAPDVNSFIPGDLVSVYVDHAGNHSLRGRVNKQD